MNMVCDGQSLQVFARSDTLGETEHQFEVYIKKGLFFQKINQTTIQYITHSDTTSRQVFEVIWPKLQEEDHQKDSESYRLKTILK